VLYASTDKTKTAVYTSQKFEVQKVLTYVAFVNIHKEEIIKT